MNEVYEAPIEEPVRKRRGLGYLLAKIGLGSFMVSLIVHVIFIVLAIFFFYKIVEPPKEKMVDFLPGGGGGGGQGGETAHKIKSTMRRSVSTAVANKKILSTSSNASFSLPETSDMADSALPMEVSSGAGQGGGAGGGRGTGTGTGAGTGTGPGKGFGEGQLGLGALIPTIMKGRCTDSERRLMLQEAGGTPEVENAVKKSLAWLHANQNEDGSWGQSYKVAMTGMSVLCFLGHCESTQSSEYGITVAKGITFLINNAQKNGGRMASDFGGHGGWVYEHAIATYALSEAYTFSKNLQFPIPELENTVKNGATIIIQGQNVNGSWDYKYDSESNRNDLSVSGWQMQALKAAGASGVKLDGFDECIRKAVRCIGDKTGDKGCYVDDGVFAYAGGSAANRPAMTPVGVLCLQHWHKENTSPAKQGIKYIMGGLKERAVDPGKRKTTGKPQSVFLFDYDDNCDLYAFYYACQVMRNAGGDEWDAMNKAILEEILPTQAPDGSFKLEANKTAEYLHDTTTAGSSRKFYVQCLNTLILEVYYRFLPATSSGKSGGSFGLDDLR